jgi:hypothetical protein
MHHPQTASAARGRLRIVSRLRWIDAVAISFVEEPAMSFADVRCARIRGRGSEGARGDTGMRPSGRRRRTADGTCSDARCCLCWIEWR